MPEFVEERIKSGTHLVSCIFVTFYCINQVKLFILHLDSLWYYLEYNQSTNNVAETIKSSSVLGKGLVNTNLFVSSLQFLLIYQS